MIFSNFVCFSESPNFNQQARKGFRPQRRAIFFEEFFWRIVLNGILWEEFFVYIGIDLFVKSLVFVKILSQCQEGQEFRYLEVRGKLIALKIVGNQKPKSTIII
jgi:hypothetical protein